MLTFNQLPLAIQSQVKATLCAYDRCTVELTQTNQYKVTTVIALHSGSYNEIIGEFHKEDIFTADEMIINYVKTFKDYPSNYNGKRNYSLLSGDWTNATLENGNIVFI